MDADPPGQQGLNVATAFPVLQIDFMASDPPNIPALIPELAQWNNGAGIDAEAWVGCVGSYELAIGYSLFFWPSFVRRDGYILREGFSEKTLDNCGQQPNASRASIEAMVNHIHLADIHYGVPSTEAQLRYLGRVLKDIYETKLRRDFPDLRFVVSFNDEAGLALTDYQLTFWQEASE